MPKVLRAGEAAGVLTEEGARLLRSQSGKLQAGIPHVSAGRRCRYRHGSHQQRCQTYRKRICRYFRIWYGSSGERAVKSIPGNRPGDHSGMATW